MIRWSPMSSVFSMEPEGITRACPSVPLISMKASITQNQAMASLLTLELMEASASLAGASFVFTLIASAFTVHLNDETAGSLIITAIRARWRRQIEENGTQM